MHVIEFDFNKSDGKIKPMNAVNNGPATISRRTGLSNFESYSALEIPYARNHDAALFLNYGGEHVVDVHRIFKNFEADENDPASYIFGPTDNYIQDTLDAGTQTFYRLGAAIEHGYKYGTYPPKDYKKWARICEHIIMHYNEGWANGFHYGIEYWEIWNEPDCVGPCWQGTKEQFYEFFEVVLYHLKDRFKDLKIGGPALCSVTDSRDTFEGLLQYLNRNGQTAPLDFFSWHMYGNDPSEFERKIDLTEEILNKYGYSGIENILNEWNYIKGWSNEEWDYSIRAEKGLKGSSFVAGAMCVCQAKNINMLMYYDARPCVMCGLFETETLRPLKTYYVFEMFRDLRRLGDYIPTKYMCNGIYTCAATDHEGNYGIMISFFDDNDDAEPKSICIDFTNTTNKTKVEYYLIDENHDNALVREETFTADSFKAYIKMSNYSTYYIKITK